MLLVKRWIVSALDVLCGVFGHRRACVLARWSSDLDERWGTDVWETVNPWKED